MLLVGVLILMKFVSFFGGTTFLNYSSLFKKLLFKGLGRGN